MAAKLGVLAGAGALPKAIIAAALAENRPLFVVALEGHADSSTVEGIPHIFARLGKAGKILSALKQAGVHDVVMAGAVRRPSLAELMPDWYTARFFARLGYRVLGDDGLLRAIATLLEREGFCVVGAGDLVKDLLAPEGAFGTISPGFQAQADIARGVEVVNALGLLDVGQAAVVQQGIVLGVEAAEGTDALISRTASLARPGARPVLVKRAKPQQDNRVDLPTIGKATLEAVAQAAFAGIAVEAGRTIVLDLPDLAGTANRLNLFLTGVR